MRPDNVKWQGNYVLKDFRMISQQNDTPNSEEALILPAPMPFSISVVPGAVGTFQITTTLPVSQTSLNYVAMSFLLKDGTHILQAVTNTGNGEGLASKIDRHNNVLQGTLVKTFYNYNGLNGIFSGRFERVRTPTDAN